MTATITEATIEAHAELPLITITRDFASTPDKVFRCWTDEELVAQWMGPDRMTTRIDHWDCRTGGSYRFASVAGDEEVASFFGSFHRVRTDERIVWTFTWEGMPDGVVLETITFAENSPGITRVTTVTVCDSYEQRDGILSSGMEVGVHDGYAKMDALLKELA